MKNKIIVSDLDGTLIGSSQQLTSTAIKAIGKFVKLGNIFSIATGRAYEGLVEKICKEIGLAGFQIVRGGSEIISSKDGTVVWGKYIENDLVTQINNRLSQNKNILLLAENGKNLYTIEGKGHEEFATGAEIKKMSELPKDKTPKIAIPPLFTEAIILPIYEQLSADFPTLHIVKTTSQKGMGIDINDGGAGKHAALLTYAELIKRNPKDIIGVGDSYNDYPLLSACGTKIAMGNAPNELKEIADMVVETQENDGIVEVINYALK